MKKTWNTIGYGLLLGTCKLAGWLPYWFLYGMLVPFLYFLLYKIVGYRVNVVRENLRNAFPEKSEEERHTIERKFYMHLSELFVDTIDITSISKKQACKRFRYLNTPEQEERMKDTSWICAMAHYGSWEYTFSYPLFTNHRVKAVYHYLHNPVFDRFYHRIRSRFGADPVETKDVIREVIKSRQPGSPPIAIALIADQTPKAYTIDHWFEFLNQPTAFFMGTGKIARKFKMPIYFMNVKKLKRGYYTAKFEKIYDGETPLEEHEIVELYVRRLERKIRERPELWLWSHRRWKHKPSTVTTPKQ